ncbi:uncharacterized protein RAG0_13139 [Rhynchosporium agropyri]|uniref:Uncharacterized protein n=1 Tax=Rhynchosporium agropyri TaxID=914238 RepID=A0A1E1LBA5_9HELO|nr:uncharacterized protein RAG0_13139 [Rhynchosporium agropyri]
MAPNNLLWLCFSISPVARLTTSQARTSLVGFRTPYPLKCSRARTHSCIDVMLNHIPSKSPSPYPSSYPSHSQEDAISNFPLTHESETPIVQINSDLPTIEYRIL